MSVYIYLFYIGAVLACVFLILSIVLFFNFNITKVVNDLSGRSSRKTIEKAREQNLKSGKKKYKSSTVNIERGKVTDKIGSSGNLRKATDINYASISTDKLDTTSVLCESTSVLSASQSNETAVLSTEFDATTVIGNNDSQNLNDAQTQQQAKKQSGKFEVEEDIQFFESAEIIKGGE